jgi:hypothetical protein
VDYPGISIGPPKCEAGDIEPTLESGEQNSTFSHGTQSIRETTGKQECENVVIYFESVTDVIN